MFFKKISLLLLFLSISVLVKAQTQLDSVLTLAQCVDIAIKNNIDVKKSETQMERDRINWQQARENLLPTLNGSVSHTVSFGRSQDPTTYNYVNQKVNIGQYSLSSGIALSSGMSLINGIKQNALLYQAGKMDFQQLKDLTTLNIISLYLTVLNNEDQLTQANLQFEGSKISLDRETILNNAGSVPPGDFYTIRGTHNNDELNLINSRNTLLSSKLDLLEAMNVPYTKDIKLQRVITNQLLESYDQTPEQIYSTALTDLALVKAADLRVKAAEKRVQVAKGKLYPQLSLSGSIYTSYSSTGTTSFGDQFRNNYSYGPTLNLSIPFLNYFQNHNNVRLAKLDLQDYQNADDNIRVQVKQQITQAYSNMQSSYQKYKVLVDQVAAYQEAFNASLTRFNSGVITANIFIIDKNNLDIANSNLISARYDYLARLKILDYYRGKLSF